MVSNKERIENFKARLGGLQDSMSHLEMGMANKLLLIEENLQRLTDTVISSCEGSPNHSLRRSRPSRPNKEERSKQPETDRQGFYSKLAKLDFPMYTDDDLMEWFNRIKQFFEF